MHRNNIPEDLTDFYILHEGFVTVSDDELKEIDYDEIDEKSYQKNQIRALLQLVISIGLHQLFHHKIELLG